MTTFFQRFGRDILYISIIACMAGWIWVDKKKAVEWNKILSVSTEQSVEHIHRSNNHLLYEIDRLKNAYPSSSNLMVQARSWSANRLVADLATKIAKVKAEWSFDKEKNAHLVKELKVSTRQLCDSFALFSEGDNMLKIKMNGFLEQTDTTQFWGLIQNYKGSAAKIALSTLEQKAALAYYDLLNYLCTKTAHPDMIFDSFEPISNTENAAIQVGETYQANIFLSPFDSFTKNVTIKVDGKFLPTTLGQARYTQQFSSPGKKKYLVEITLKNPLTGVVKSFKKEFGLIVVDSCL